MRFNVVSQKGESIELDSLVNFDVAYQALWWLKAIELQHADLAYALNNNLDMKLIREKDLYYVKKTQFVSFIKDVLRMPYTLGGYYSEDWRELVFERAECYLREIPELESKFYEFLICLDPSLPRKLVKPGGDETPSNLSSISYKRGTSSDSIDSGFGDDENLPPGSLDESLFEAGIGSKSGTDISTALSGLSVG
ncbi:hypothetical protein RLOatenuis_4560 [Rickettsiales bacterium]|nr:hypothetical protein RLOatenuis_4560 [Rickettsiales bacterium]